MNQYDPTNPTAYYDALGEDEWQRLVANPLAEVSLHLHSHYLRQYVQPGQRVLEIGPGPGRFTQQLAEIGAHVVVGDISPVQLELNRQYAARLGFAAAVEDWHLLDICELAGIVDDSFDVVLAYGGPLSYALDQRRQALAHCRRVLRPQGLLLCSVMSLWGTIHRFLGAVLEIAPEYNQRIIASGDLTAETWPSRTQHWMHMYRAGEFQALLRQGGFDVLALSSSGTVSVRWEQELQALREDPARWQELLAIELEASAEPGCLDMGTHLLAVAKKI
jgi:SAM-dependent methyltransferase